MIASTTPMAPRMAAILFTIGIKLRTSPKRKDDAYDTADRGSFGGTLCGRLPLDTVRHSILLLDLGELCTIHAIGVRTFASVDERSFPIALSADKNEPAFDGAERPDPVEWMP